MNRHLTPAEREAMVRQQARDSIETPIEKVLARTVEADSHNKIRRYDIYLARVRFLEERACP